MADPSVRVRDNNRRILRGFTFDDKSARYVCQVFEGETIKPTLNLADWLGTETISAVTLTTEGSGTITQANASGIITFTVSGISRYCDLDALITTSGGRIRREKLRFMEPRTNGRDDYGSFIGT